MFTIVRPVWNDHVQQGQVVVKVTPPKVGMTQVTQLEFKWLDAPPAWCGKPPCPPYVNQFPIDTPLLLQGYQVPGAVTRGHMGRWEVRAQASGKAVPGPWSFPVQFQLFLTQPTQSQQQAPAPSPVQQTAPLPSSSVTQAPPLMMQQALPPSSPVEQPSPVPQAAPVPSSVIQAPPPSSPATQMRRSPSMIMPRGVDEKESGSKTAEPNEPAKKP